VGLINLLIISLDSHLLNCPKERKNADAFLVVSSYIKLSVGIVFLDHHLGIHSTCVLSLLKSFCAGHGEVHL
jgi:hypothetical protein